MAGRFYLRKFADINLDDEFFDTLKADYPGNIMAQLSRQKFNIFIMN